MTFKITQVSYNVGGKIDFQVKVRVIILCCVNLPNT